MFVYLGGALFIAGAALFVLAYRSRKKEMDGATAAASVGGMLIAGGVLLVLLT